MKDYRLFLLDKDGRIVSGHTMTCADDEAAVAAAREIWPNQTRELWNLARRVGLLEPETDGSQ
jgi:hypothetical protein